MGSPRAKASSKTIFEKETIMCFTCFKANEASFCLVNLYGSLYKAESEGPIGIFTFLLNIITSYFDQFNQFSEHLSDIIRDGHTS